jgi:ATP-dependent exoDNAse (exonuclease V) alpha subunit
LALAVGDRIRITAGGKTRDGKHRLSNGSLFTVEGFTKRGDIIVDKGWVIDREFGHLTHGFCATSHASQGVTVNKVFVGMSADSLAATNQRTAYVALTRGKEQVQIFTDDKEALLEAMRRLDEPLSATELGQAAKSQDGGRKGKAMTTAQQLEAVARHHRAMQQKHVEKEREVDYDR